MILTVLLLLASLAIIIIGGHGLVDGASSMAKRYKIPNIVIGLTIVAFGTSTPELVVSVYGAMSNNPDIAIGNVVGSNIFNVVLLVLGGKLFVDQAVKLALEFGISQSIVGLTIVAAGTSLPELVTSVIASIKKNHEIAVGNIVGSNIFNAFLSWAQVP